MPMTPIPPLDQSSTTFKSDVGTFFGTRMPLFVQEANALQANLSAIAAGGAYALPYVWKSAGVAGGMNIGGSSTSQQNAVAFDINNIAANGIDVSPLLLQYDQSSSTVKGYIRLIKANDSSSFLVFAVTGRTPVTSSGYQYVTGFAVHASAVNPFANGDSVLMYFQRTGDKGSPSYTNYLKVSDRKPTGSHGGSTGSNSGYQTVDRAFNTVNFNDIPNSSVSNNQVSLPPGTYDYFGWAPSTVTMARAGLFNVTDAGYVEWGTPAIGSATSNQMSFFSGRVTITKQTVFVVREVMNIGQNNQWDLGYAANIPNMSEIYSSLEFRKIA